MDAPLLLSAPKAHRAWSVALVTFTLLATPSIASAKPNVGLIYLGRSEAVKAQIKDAMEELFVIAPDATNAELTKAWGKTSGVKLKQRSLGDSKTLFDLAEASGVELILVADIEIKGRRRRQRPTRVHLSIIQVEEQLLVATERLPVKTQSSGRRRRTEVALPSQISTFFARVMEKLEGGGNEGDAAASNDDVDGSNTTGDGSDVALQQRVGRISRSEWSRANRTVIIDAYGLARGRSFAYSDIFTDNLREFDSGLSFGAGIRFEYYPLSFGRASGTTRRVGIVGSYAQDFGVEPSIDDLPDVPLSHSWRDWYIGAAVAWDFDAVLIKSTATFGEYDASFDETDEFIDANQLPDVSYQNLALGVSGRLELDSFAAFLDSTYTFIRRAGSVGDDLFPNAAVGGLRFRAGVSYPLAGTLEAFAAGTYDRFFYDLRPRRGDEFVAGGALDEQLSGELGISYAY